MQFWGVIMKITEERKQHLLEELRDAWTYELTNYYSFTPSEAEKAYRNRVEAVNNCRKSGIGNSDIDDVMYEVSNNAERDVPALGLVQ